MNDTTALLPDVALRFHIDHPSIEEAYCDGYESASASANVKEEDNPFKLGSIESDHWIEGWWAGFYGEPPLFIDIVAEPVKPTVSKVESANDHIYHDQIEQFIIKFLEISGVLALSALVGYQIIDMVA